MNDLIDFWRFKERYEGKSVDEIRAGAKFMGYHIKNASGLTYEEVKRQHKELGAVCGEIIGRKRREAL